MQSAAYDTLNSLKAITTEKIQEIEDYLTQNRSTWFDELDCCKSEDYKKQTEFSFLPGHKTIVLMIPEQIKQMSDAKQIATVAKKKKVRDDKELINNLISNVVNYMEKNGLVTAAEIVSANNIREFKRGNEIEDFVCKCLFACPFCSKVFPLTYKKFWMSSNLTYHLKNHITSDYDMETEEYMEENQADD